MKRRPHERPHAWIHPDRDIHKKYMPFLRQRSQAWYRLEEWTLTFEEYLSFWNEAAWSMRGRRSDSICMTRIDWEGPWSNDNVELVTRLEVLKRNVAHRTLKRRLDTYVKGLENGTYR